MRAMAAEAVEVLFQYKATVTRDQDGVDLRRRKSRLRLVRNLLDQFSDPRGINANLRKRRRAPAVIERGRRCVSVRRRRFATRVKQPRVFWRRLREIHGHAELGEMKRNEIVVVIVLRFGKHPLLPRPRKRPIMVR